MYVWERPREPEWIRLSLADIFLNSECFINDNAEVDEGFDNQPYPDEYENFITFTYMNGESFAQTFV